MNVNIIMSLCQRKEAFEEYDIVFDAIPRSHTKLALYIGKTKIAALG